MAIVPIFIFLIFILTIFIIFVDQRVIYHRGLRFLDIPYYLAPVIASILIFLSGSMGLEEIYIAITGYPYSEGLSFLYGNGPFSIVILFLSTTFIALTLDVSGFFKYLSIKVLKRVHGSGRKIFIAIYLMTCILTLFTSNDILILTLTPFLIEFLRHSSIKPVPFLVSEFFATNTLSMGLLIGNPTNIIVATVFGLNFVEYFKIMIIPALTAGFITFIGLYLIFRRDINDYYKIEALPEVKLTIWNIIGIILLAGTLISLTVLSLQGYLLWHISLFWAILTFFIFCLPNLFVTLMSGGSYKDSYLFKISNKMPWEIVPFVLGFFVIIRAFSISGITSIISDHASVIFGGSPFGSIVGIGVLSTVSANLFNNIPMTVLFSDMLADFAVEKGVVYSLVMGSNLGANLTPIGALAGIMWMRMLSQEKIDLTFKQFMIYGIKITLITTIITASTIYAIFVLIE